jgi:hypothetical protein
VAGLLELSTSQKKSCRPAVAFTVMYLQAVARTITALSDKVPASVDVSGAVADVSGAVADV